MWLQEAQGIEMTLFANTEKELVLQASEGRVRFKKEGAVLNCSEKGGVEQIQ